MLTGQVIKFCVWSKPIGFVIFEEFLFDKALETLDGEQAALGRDRISTFNIPNRKFLGVRSSKLNELFQHDNPQIYCD